MSQQPVETKIDKDIEEMLNSIGNNSPWHLILFNDDHHDMLEVLRQIMKAIKCDSTKAKGIMLQAHRNGQATVMTGDKTECQKAQKILEEIDLATDLIEGD